MSASPPTRRPHPAVTGACIGALATALQVSVSRELLGLWGGSELAIAATLVSWLLGLSIASLIGSRVEPGRALSTVSVAAFAASVSLLVALRLSPVLSNLPPGGEPSAPWLFAWTLLGAAPAGGLVGFAFTCAARLATGSEGATLVYTFEAVGALVGGSTFAFLFAGRVPHLVVTAGSSALLLCLVGISHRRIPKVAMLAGTAVAIGVFAFLAWQIEVWSTGRALLLPGRLLAAAETPYTRAAVLERLGERQLVLDGRVADTFPEPYDKPLGVHLALLQRRAPRSLLVLGAPPADLAEAALSHGLDKVVFVEMDSWLHKLLRPLWPASTQRALSDPRVTVVETDGRVTLARSQGEFDSILIQTGPARSLSVARFHTVEAFADAKRALTPSGVLTVIVGGAASELSPASAVSAGAELVALRQVFPRVEVAAGLDLVMHAGRDDSELTVDSVELARRLEIQGATRPDPVRLADLYDRKRAADFVQQVGARPVRPGSDLRPTAHLWATAKWAELWLDASAASLVAWSSTALAAALIMAGLVIGLGTKSLKQRRLGGSLGLVALASTGMCGMSLQIASLFVYQIASGALYLGLSLLLGLFMAGLALGAVLGDRLAKTSPRAAVRISEGSTVLACLAGAVVLPLGANCPAVVLAFTPVLGAVTGLAFPVFLAFCRERDSDKDPIGAVTAADHAGAAIGALLTGLVLLPGLGVVGTALALALQKAALAAVLLSWRRPPAPPRFESWQRPTSSRA